MLGHKTDSEGPACFAGRGTVARWGCPVLVPPLSPALPSPKHAPGVPRILVGNRLHLAFKRQVPTEQARAYAEKNGMTFFEVSPLCNFNVIESFTELSRIVLMRHGMEKIWRPNRGEALSQLRSGERRRMGLRPPAQGPASPGWRGGRVPSASLTPCS